MFWLKFASAVSFFCANACVDYYCMLGDLCLYQILCFRKTVVDDEGREREKYMLVLLLLVNKCAAWRKEKERGRGKKTRGE